MWYCSHYLPPVLLTLVADLPLVSLRITQKSRDTVPLSLKSRQLASMLKVTEEAQFKKLQQAGIIRRSNSAWALPCTWCQTRTAPGAHSVTTIASTKSPYCYPTPQHAGPGHKACGLHHLQYHWPVQGLTSIDTSHPLIRLSTFPWVSAWGTLLKHSKGP